MFVSNLPQNNLFFVAKNDSCSESIAVCLLSQKMSAHECLSQQSFCLCVQIAKGVLVELSTVYKELQTAFTSAGAQWADAVDQIWSFGPKRCGPNMLINRVENYKRLSVWSVLEHKDGCVNSPGEVKQNDSSIIAGFQMATQAGPLCEEPMQGVCFVIERWEDAKSKRSDSSISNMNQDSKKGSVNERQPFSNSTNGAHTNNTTKEDSVNGEGGTKWVKKGREVFGPLSGQLMSVVKEGCRKAFQTMPQRLMVAMYHCAILASTEVLGDCSFNEREGD